MSALTFLKLVALVLVIVALVLLVTGNLDHVQISG